MEKRQATWKLSILFGPHLLWGQLRSNSLIHIEHFNITVLQFRCPPTNNQTDVVNQKTNSPNQQQNDELFSYIRSLEERILTLEEGKTNICRDGVSTGVSQNPAYLWLQVLLGKIRGSVSQQHSPISTTPTSTTHDFTLQASVQNVFESSQSRPITYLKQATISFWAHWPDPAQLITVLN